ncbi:proteasome activator protein [Acanthamoeba castellanii str. Neff]|uniref:Proteasome activator protein n=1 Tax=Acanthamoeba castellanii (strain ATCC 30010 / Neff) TaxID=1257118 RepID=L8H6L8_ACACF|nr:proteasome activator protein [Acanthamoeba castellanii str. Neff]ELR20081.1 proteasome activator protein [Acanthamoeba castellanii str. Neff]
MEGTPTNVDAKKQVDELWEAIAQTANQHFKHSMPERILKLSTLLKSDDFSLRAGQVGQEPRLEEDETAAPPSKRARVEGSKGAVPVNKALARVVPAIKEEILAVIDIFNSVKIWIQLSIPRIEAGNTFGVDIQTDTISELSRAEDAAYSLLEGITKYYVTRGKLISKVLKHPEIEDYSLSVVELDEKEYLNMRLSTLDLRNNMAIIYDLLSKNWDRIQKPTSSHHTTMF